MRFVAITLGVLVFAVVLLICGEAMACDSCAHACCAKVDRAERPGDVSSRTSKVHSDTVCANTPALGLAEPSVLSSGSQSATPFLLVMQAAPLRI